MPIVPFYRGPISSAVTASPADPAPSMLSSLESPILHAIGASGDAGVKRADMQYKQAQTAHTVGEESRAASAASARAGVGNGEPRAWDVEDEPTRNHVVSGVFSKALAEGADAGQAAEAVSTLAAAHGWENQAARMAYASKGFKLGKDDAMSVATQGVLRQQDFDQQKIIEGGHDAAKMYGDDQQLKGAEYGADKSLAASIYGANASAGASKYSADSTAKTAVRGQDVGAATAQRDQDAKSAVAEREQDIKRNQGNPTNDTKTTTTTNRAESGGGFMNWNHSLPTYVPAGKVATTITKPNPNPVGQSPITAAIAYPSPTPVNPAPAAPMAALRTPAPTLVGGVHPVPPPAAIAALRANPGLGAQFEQKYGLPVGSSKQLIQGR
jgi:hypothetical protein